MMLPPVSTQKEKKQSAFTGSDWAEGKEIQSPPHAHQSHRPLLQQFKLEYVSFKSHFSHGQPGVGDEGCHTALG